MRPFIYAVQPGNPPRGKFLAGGTTLVDLMKLDVERPDTLVNVRDTKGADSYSSIDRQNNGLRLGALVTMSDAAADETLAEQYPLVTESLLLAASPQIRNMATLGGNVLQRTRCPYFRDTSWDKCNKREPGSGCAALEGHNRMHALLGASEDCVAAYPGDFAQALMALDAEVETNRRKFPFARLHNDANDPARETILAEGEMIRAFLLPQGDFRRSTYLKIRDRQSYAFATVSAAVAIEMDDDNVRDVRIALGGIAYKPWRAREAEQAMRGKPWSEQNLRAAADAALAQAKPLEHNAFKVALAKNTLMRAFQQIKKMDV